MNDRLIIKQVRGNCVLKKNASEQCMSDLRLFRVEHGNPSLSKSEADFSPITTIWIQNSYGRHA